PCDVAVTCVFWVRTAGLTGWLPAWRPVPVTTSSPLPRPGCPESGPGNWHDGLCGSAMLRLSSCGVDTVPAPTRHDRSSVVQNTRSSDDVNSRKGEQRAAVPGQTCAVRGQCTR